MSSFFRVAVTRNMDPDPILREVAVLLTPLEVGVQFSPLEKAALLDAAQAVGAILARNMAIEAVPGAYAVFSATMSVENVGPFLLAAMDDQKVRAEA